MNRYRRVCLLSALVCLCASSVRLTAQTAPAAQQPPAQQPPAQQPPAQEKKPQNPFETVPEQAKPEQPAQQQPLETPKPVETPKPQGQVVEAIEFRGARRVPQDTLRALIFTKKGDIYNEDALRR